MIVRVRIEASPDGVSIRAPEAKLNNDLPNVMMIDASGKIHAIGERLDSPGLRRVAIYEAANFAPETTYDAIRYFTLRALSDLRRGGLGILGLFDRVDWELDLKGYELIDEDRRLRFERLLRDFTFARSYSLNGAYRRLPPNLLR